MTKSSYWIWQNLQELKTAEKSSAFLSRNSVSQRFSFTDKIFFAVFTSSRILENGYRQIDLFRQAFFGPKNIPKEASQYNT